MTAALRPSTALLVRAITEAYPLASTALRKAGPEGLEALAMGMERYLKDPEGYASSALQLREGIEALDRASGRKAPLPSGPPSGDFPADVLELAEALGIDPGYVAAWRELQGPA